MPQFTGECYCRLTFVLSYGAELLVGALAVGLLVFGLSC